MSNKPYVSHWRGPKNQLNNVQKTDGQILFCTDTGEMFIDIGTNNRKKVTNDASSFLGVVNNTNDILETIDNKTIFTPDIPPTEVFEIGINIGDFFRVGTDFTITNPTGGYIFFILTLYNEELEEEAHGGDILIVVDKKAPEQSNHNKWEIVVDVLHVDTEWNHVHNYTTIGTITATNVFSTVEKNTIEQEVIKNIEEVSIFNGVYTPGQGSDSGNLKLIFTPAVNIEKITIPTITYIESVDFKDGKGINIDVSEIEKTSFEPIANPNKGGNS